MTRLAAMRAGLGGARAVRAQPRSGVVSALSARSLPAAANPPAPPRCRRRLQALQARDHGAPQRQGHPSLARLPRQSRPFLPPPSSAAWERAPSAGEDDEGEGVAGGEGEASAAGGESSNGVKVPSANTILIGLTVLVGAATWILPAGSFDRSWSEVLQKEVPVPGTYHSVPQVPQGLVAMLLAPITGVQASMDICLFLLIIGGFLSVVNKTGAIDAGIERAVGALKGREIWMIPILMLLFAANASSWGMFEESIPFFPILIPVMMRAGFDKLTALGTILVGCGMGLIGSLSNAFATVLASQAVGVPFTEGIVPRAVILVCCFAAGVVHVVRYALKVKADPSASLVAASREEDLQHFTSQGGEGKATEMTPRRAATLVMFTLAFVVMVWGVAAHGWSMNDMSALFLGSSSVVAVINGVSEEDFWAHFMEGCKDMLGVSLVIGLATGIVNVMNAGFITDTILDGMANTIAGLPGVVCVNAMFLLEGALSFLIPSSSGLAMLTMPIMAPLADFSGVARHLLVTAYQSANGMVNMVTPTSGVVMGALAIARVGLFKWVEFLSPLLLQVFLINAIVLSMWAALI